ncbi:MAG TPA: phage minor capsid protein [Arthrobacter sp.]|nr:phage minor capsid protein [Arthrobacter sp.]
MEQEPDSLPVTVDAAAAAVVLVYADAEQSLLVRCAALIRDAVLAGPGSRELASLYADLRRETERTAALLRSRSRALAAHVVGAGARNGNTAATRQVAKHSDVVPLLPHDVNSARLLAQDLDHRLTAASTRVARFADDAYRAATVAAALEQILPAKASPAEAQAQAWRQLVSRGITGFTDKAGREWNLTTYVEMAVRTATQRAYNASHRERLTLAGIHYFTISTTGRPCGLCAPWEGKVLADAGEGTVTEPHAGGGDPVTFRVAGTVEEAMAAGLFHPNCKHTLTAYLPGVTVLRGNQWTVLDELNYRNTQTLRRLERAVRASKLQAAAALTPLEKARAMRDVREGQARIREFTARTGLLRRRQREQINNGYV